MSKFLSLSTGAAFLSGLVLAASASAQTAYLMKDINTTPSTTLQSSNPYPNRPSTSYSAQKWAQMGGASVFAASTSATGTELFTSDGKTASLLLDIYPGSSSSSPSQFAIVGKQIFFAANDGTNGTELWVTDGTKAGTKLVKDIYTGSSSSSPYYLTPVAGKCVFRANDGTNGTELWVSDGTAAGTTLLMDIYVGTSSGSPTYIQSNFATTQAFFYANDGKIGYELYVTDGTAAGTKLVKDINTSSATASSYPRYFQHLGATKVVFEANDGVNGQELWVTDGTAAGTTLVADVYAGSTSGTYCYYAVSLGSKVIFRGRTSAAGYEAWVTDGTKAGTMLLNDNYPGTSSGYVYYPCVEGSNCYFGAGNASGSYGIYVTDGTPAGTKLYGPAKFSSSSPSYLHAMKGTVYCYARDVTAGTGYEISVTDGTTAKTFQDTYKGTSSGYAYYCSEIAPGIIGFRANDGVAGSELWVTDGTAAGTKMFDLNPPITPTPTASDNVQYIAPLFGKVIFTATDGTDKTKGQSGQELWISDGTTAGTKLLKDIYVGTSTTSASSSNPYYMCRLGNYVYFRATDGASGYEVWRTDGTTAGTTLFKDIYVGSSGSSPYGFTRIKDKIYFYATDGTTGYELWVLDGTAAGTKLVKDIRPGSSSSYPRDFVRLGLTDKFVFECSDGTNGYEPYISDGTAAGTMLLKDIRSGTSSGYCNYPCAWGNKVYFSANDGTTGYELWETDGTTAGTKLVKDINPGSGSGYAYYTALQNDMLYMYAYDTTNGYELWKSDGTAAGTVLYKQFNAGTTSTSPRYITAVGSRRIYYAAYYGTNSVGTEPFFTDVTTGSSGYWNLNTSSNSYPYNLSGGRYNFCVDSGNVWFRANPNASGTDYRLWRIANGGTAHSIGRIQDSSFMTATDPLIGKNMTVKGATSVKNPLSVLCLGVATSKPTNLGTFVPDSYAYFQLTNFFWIVGNYPGLAWGSVFPVPNDASLLGDMAVLQAFALNALTFPNNTEVTNGVHLTIGK